MLKYATTAKMGIMRGCEMTLSYIAHSVFRFIQLVLAIAVIGLYGTDLSAAHKQHKYSDGKWVCSPSPPLASPNSNSHSPIQTHLSPTKQSLTIDGNRFTQ